MECDTALDEEETNIVEHSQPVADTSRSVEAGCVKFLLRVPSILMSRVRIEEAGQKKASSNEL